VDNDTTERPHGLALTPNQVIKAFGGWIQTEKPQIIEVGVKDKPLLRQRAKYDFTTGKLTRIGDSYKVGSAKHTQADKLNRLAEDYFQAMGRYYAATRGVGQFLPDPNKERVAQEALQAASVIAEQYKAMGGNLKDLGIGEGKPGNRYKTPEEVGEAYQAGQITEPEADKILREQFGFK